MLKYVQRERSSEVGITLIELLVSMTILSILTTMILMGWFTLQRSYAQTTKSDHARVDARDAATRMVMEVRAAEAQPGKAVLAGGGVDLTDRREWVDFWTTFNHPDDLLLTRYEYRWATTASGAYTGSVYRIISPGSSNQKQRLVIANVVNGPTYPVFQYLSVDAYGTPTLLTSVPSSQVARASISAIQIHLQVDLNPGKSPTYMDIKTTAQLRNQRQF
jgi:type II secretory pathway pseudopilin PulG